jgi:hypothetical protein
MALFLVQAKCVLPLGIATPDMCAEKFPLVSLGGHAGVQACTEPGARTPLSGSGNFLSLGVMIDFFLNKQSALNLMKWQENQSVLFLKKLP